MVSDIDGTLANKDGIISNADLAALQRIYRSGVKISVCTGRAAFGCHKILNQLSFAGFHIFFDGALVTNTNLTETIYSKSIPEHGLEPVCDLARYHGMALELFSGTQYFIDQESLLADRHGQLMDLKPRVTDLSAVCRSEKLFLGCLVIPAAAEKKTLAIFSGLESQLRFISTTHPACPDLRFINITHKEVSKGQALEALILHLGLPPESVVAIGDGQNDIPLLTAAGQAVAMGNSPAELKAVADYITADVDHNGLAQAIQHYFLT
jgi:Cof subfamily protein (haloacid dehalogenase superfamily)